MNRFISSAIVAFLLIFATENIQAQDIHFSQFYENTILRNPALTGIFSGDYKAGINYRNQWSSISVPFETGLASVETRVGVGEEAMDFLSFGATLTYDHAGSINFNSMQIYPALNYNKSLEDDHNSYLSAGFTAGYIQRSVDPNKMKFASQYVNGNYSSNNAGDPSITNVKQSYMDLGAGISFNSSFGDENAVNYYIGIAGYHLNRPKAAFDGNQAFVRTDMKWNGNLGFNMNINQQIGLTFHANYSKQGSYTETIAGALASWRRYDGAMNTIFMIYGGLFYRYKDAIIPTVKLDYKKYSFTLSYDINSSSLNTASNYKGGFEISVFTRGLLTKGLWAQDKTKCPRFENMLIPTTE